MSGRIVAGGTLVRKTQRSERRSILLVDDEPSIRQVVGGLLESRGFDVLSAESGEEALKIVTAQDFELAIVDYRLPAMDGIRLLHVLREISPFAPRILMTAHLDLNTAVEAVNMAQISNTLTKPIMPEALFRCVDEALANKALLLGAQDKQRRQRLDRERGPVLECLAGNFLRLALQPIFDLGCQTPVAYEALLRSGHPEFTGPLSVLRAVEEHELVHELGDKVVELARGWLAQLPTDKLLFINLHPLELDDAERLGTRLRRLQEWSGRVVIEITERQSLDSIDDWESAIETLADQGIPIAVDDLGAGYNSLSVLADLQPRFLKADMSIVRACNESPRKQRLIELLCRFAESTSAELIAEGIEADAEIETLKSCGAHYLQGYRLGRPSFDIH